MHFALDKHAKLVYTQEMAKSKKKSRGGRAAGWARWSELEDEFIRDHYLQMPITVMASFIGRSVSAVRNRRSMLGCVTSHAFTAEEVCEKARQLGLTNQGRNKKPHPLPAKKSRRKTANAEELRALQSETTSRRHRVNGHPMSGRHHSEETRRVMSESIRLGHAARSKKEKTKTARKGVATKVARFGKGGGFAKSPYSRCLRGHREDLGGLFVRSSWEANYARYLNMLVSTGNILRWSYETKRFVFPGETRGAVTYTPDFEVFMPDGRVEYHEVKGWMDGKSRTRLRRMAKHYPEISVVLIDSKVYHSIEREHGKSIPHWEFPIGKKAAA